MTVYDFKRLILTDNGRPFFLERDIPNSMTLSSLYQNSNVINISYDLDNWTTVVKEFNSNNKVMCKLDKNNNVKDVIN